jgi:hypothetical protein
LNFAHSPSSYNVMEQLGCDPRNGVPKISCDVNGLSEVDTPTVLDSQLRLEVLSQRHP